MRHYGSSPGVSPPTGSVPPARAWDRHYLIALGPRSSRDLAESVSARAEVDACPVLMADDPSYAVLALTALRSHGDTRVACMRRSEVAFRSASVSIAAREGLADDSADGPAQRA